MQYDSDSLDVLARTLLHSFSARGGHQSKFAQLWPMVTCVDRFCRAATTKTEIALSEMMMRVLDEELRRYAPYSRHPDAAAVAELLGSKPAKPWKALVRHAYDQRYKK